MRRCRSRSSCALRAARCGRPRVAQPAGRRPDASRSPTGAAVSRPRRPDVRRRPPAPRSSKSDVLRTGADGRLSVMLKDESRLALGPEQRTGADRASPTRRPTRSSASALRLARGVLSYVSGLIAKLAPESVQLQTPTVDHRRARHARARAGGGAVTAAPARPWPSRLLLAAAACGSPRAAASTPPRAARPRRARPASGRRARSAPPSVTAAGAR